MSEKAILIGLITPGVTQDQAYEYLDELVIAEDASLGLYQSRLSFDSECDNGLVFDSEVDNKYVVTNTDFL